MANMAQPRAWHVVLSISKMLYVCGGSDGIASLASCEVYDTCSASSASSADSWKAMTPMLERRCYHAGVECEGKLYCFGGIDAIHETTAERFDPSSGKWSALAEMTFARSGYATVVLKLAA